MTQPEIPKEMPRCPWCAENHPPKENCPPDSPTPNDMSEAAARYSTTDLGHGDFTENEDLYNAFIAGATWAKSQAASEVEAKCSCNPLLSSPCECRIAGAKQERERCAKVMQFFTSTGSYEYALSVLSRPSREGEE